MLSGTSILTKDDVLNIPWFRIIYDPTKDKVRHVAKFSEVSDDVLMTNTHAAKGGPLLFDNRADAETMAEALTTGKSKAYYPFIVEEISPANVKRLLQKAPKAVRYARKTKYGMAWDLIPLPDNVILDLGEKKIIQSGELYLKRNDMKGFYTNCLNIRKEHKDHIIQYFYSKGINVFELIS